MGSGRRAGKSVKNSSLFVLALNFGWNLLVSILVLGFLGRWLDGRFGTDPWLMIIGILLGIAVGFKGLIAGVLESEKDRRGEKG